MYQRLPSKWALQYATRATYYCIAGKEITNYTLPHSIEIMPQNDFFFVLLCYLHLLRLLDTRWRVEGLNCLRRA